MVSPCRAVRAAPRGLRNITLMCVRAPLHGNNFAFLADVCPPQNSRRCPPSRDWRRPFRSIKSICPRAAWMRCSPSIRVLREKGFRGNVADHTSLRLRVNFPWRKFESAGMRARTGFWDVPGGRVRSFVPCELRVRCGRDFFGLSPSAYLVVKSAIRWRQPHNRRFSARFTLQIPLRGS